MESTKLFEDRKLRPKPPTRPLWLVLTVSAVLPGAGHALVRKLPLGAALLAVALIFAGGAITAVTFGLHHLGWLAGRISTLAALFAAVDATLLSAEQGDRRVWRRTDRPRLTAFLNLVGYGLGSLRQGARVQALIFVALGLAMHGWLGQANLPLAVIAEVVVGVFAYIGYRLAQDKAYAPAVSTEFGELGSSSAPAVPSDSTPRWVLPALGFMCVVVFSGTLGVYALQTTILDAMEVRQDRALVMEPFYRNPEYGLSVEMNAPGWAFRAPQTDEFVAAQHMAEDTQLQLSIQPRIPLISNDRTAALAAIAEASFRGYGLQILEEGATQVGGRKGYWMSASGTFGGQAREVSLFTTGRSWRQYVLWFEWGPGHDVFARSEMQFVLDTLSIENAAPAARRSEGTLAR